jgi:hypothetical protein
MHSIALVLFANRVLIEQFKDQASVIMFVDCHVVGAQ